MVGMDQITGLVQKSRGEALSVGDYGQYRKSCAGRILNLRRKLHIVTPKGRKFENKKTETLYPKDEEHLAEWRDYYLASSERAWAHAMHMKSLQAAETGNATLSGPTRAHIISRLVKATKSASHLIQISKQEKNQQDYLAANAYKRWLDGAVAFESQKWETCLGAFSDAQVVYTALGTAGDTATYSDWISETIEPSLRYAAYQRRLPRTLAIPKIVARFTSRDSDFIQQALQLSPSCISGDDAPSNTETDVSAVQQNLPTSIAWRGRTVKLEDARIAQALATVKESEKGIQEILASDASSSEKAAAFEKVLGPSQDAVDATKSAIDELLSEGVESSDARIQSLQITRTAVNFDLIGWRIGRNRVLSGSDDGAGFFAEPPRAVKSRKTAATSRKQGDVESTSRGEGMGRKLARLRERAVLYDSTLQSIDSVRELPGVAGDTGLLKKLVSRKAYFSALRSTTIARSHALHGNNKNALALFSRAWQHASVMDTFDDDEAEARSQVPRHYVTSEQATKLKTITQGLVVQFSGLVEMDNLEAEAIKTEKAKAVWLAPLIERMDDYPAGGADLSNLVDYPPKLRPVPVKPIFLDLAWNYIQYPGAVKQLQAAATPSDSSEAQKAPAKKGWFGFGRS